MKTILRTDVVDSSLKSPSWSLLTPASVPGAVAIIQIQGTTGAVFAALGMRPIEIGRVGVRDVRGVDRALVACVSQSCVQIMPHGGTAVVRALLRALHTAGIEEASPKFQTLYPEAENEIESRSLATLAHAASPRAVDALLAQPLRWREHAQECVPAEHAAALARLITPPIVAAVGPANVGKSTLLNALAGRQVAIAADEAGTTRDHVGVLLDVDGVTIRYIDTPGMRETDDEIERAAQSSAMDVARHAALVLLVADAGTTFVHWSPTQGQIVLRVGLRADRGMTRGAALYSSARTGEGIELLARTIREHLVPDAALADRRPWRFWQD